MYRKNVASQNLPFALVNASTGAALTGATVTARRSLDGGAQASATGSVSELGNGQYNLALSQADTNGNQIGVLLTATNAIPVHFTLVTTAADPTDSVRFGLTALPNVAAGANGGLPTGNASGQVTVGSMAADTLTNTALAASAVTEIQTGLATSAAVVTLQTSVDDLPTNAELATSQAAADDATLAAIAAVQADTDNIQTRLPAALVSGRMDASVGAMAAGTVTAAAIATDAIDNDAIAANAVTEIQAGLATAASITALNNLSQAQAQTAAAAALTAYDPPTQAELVAEINAVQTDVAGVQTSVDDLPTNAELAASQAAADDATLAAIAGLPAAPSAAVIAAQIIATVLTELTQAEPPDTPTVGQALMLPYQIVAQGGTMNATTGESTYRNGAGVVFAKRTLSDDGTTLTEGKLVSGP